VPQVRGLASIREGRDESDEIVAEHATWRHHMPPFQPALEPVMTGPHATNGTPRSRPWCLSNAQSQRAPGGERGCRAERAHGRTICDARLRAKSGLLGWWQ